MPRFIDTPYIMWVTQKIKNRLDQKVPHTQSHRHTEHIDTQHPKVHTTFSGIVITEWIQMIRYSLRYLIYHILIM